MYFITLKKDKKGKSWSTPPIFRISCSYEKAWITDPALENNQAFTYFFNYFYFILCISFLSFTL